MDGLELRITAKDVNRFYLGRGGTELLAMLGDGLPLNHFATPLSGIQTGVEVFESFLEEKLGGSYKDFRTAVLGFGSSYKKLVTLLNVNGGPTAITEASKDHYSAIK